MAILPLRPLPVNLPQDFQNSSDLIYVRLFSQTNLLVFIFALTRVFLIPDSGNTLSAAIFWILSLCLAFTYAPQTRFSKIILCLSLPTAAYLAIITNPLVVNLSYLVIYLSLFWFLITNYRQSAFLGPFEFIGNLFTYCADCLGQGLSREKFKEYLAFNFSSFSLSGYLKKTVVIFSVLLVFHFLFSQINSEYRDFTWMVIKPIYDFLRYLLNIDLIWKTAWAIVLGYFFYLLITVRPSQPPLQVSSFPIFTQSLVFTILLFFVFIFFQTKFLFTNLATLPFKSFSVYVQQGFWELLTVSVLGYALSLVCLPFVSAHNRLRSLLTIFAIELLAIVIFTYHKLLNLQSFFGLKDQRILATVAVTLILFTFITHILRLYRRPDLATIFSFQFISLLVSILLLNLINVDNLATKVNPLGYYVNGQRIKDYSYLLGNSYDNYSSWIQLNQELTTNGVVFPTEEYYWGNYQPLCVKQSSRLAPKTHLDSHFQYLINKYQSFPGQKGIGGFNYHEYQAYRLLTSHSTEFSGLTNFIKSHCSY